MLLCLFIFCLAVFPQQKLMMIGGGERTTEVMQRLVDLAGGEDSNILVITWASGVPAESFEAFKEDVVKVSKIKLANAPFAPLDEKSKQTFLEQLKNARGVFFTGGDQNRITEVLKDAEILDALKKRYTDGVVFSGTSAGTAIMSEIMITGEGDFKVVDGKKVETKKGLGLLTNAIVDQHFIARQRQNRLLGLVLENPNLLGIGIDEDTAFIVKDNRYGEVLGNSQVMIFDAKKKPFRFFMLKSGEKFDLKKRK